MIAWSLGFLVLALVAALVGFSGMFGSVGVLMKLVFLAAVTGFIASSLASAARGRGF